MPACYSIRPAADSDVAACERILRAIPEWFGMDSSIVKYVAAIPAMETYVGEHDGMVVGFITLTATSAAAVEIHVMAIARDHHGKGLGRALVEHSEQVLRSRQIPLLHVKTLGPSKTWEPYERTRAFYRAMGFSPLEENLLWGEANPCLMLVKHIGCEADKAVQHRAAPDGPRSGAQRGG